jgi:lipoprotein NlpD
MSCDRRHRATHLPAVLAAVLIAAGCANPRPAPVVNRTGVPVPPAEVDTVPGLPLPPAQAGQLPSGQGPGGVEVSPIRSGGIESGSSSVPSASEDPNLRTGPKGFKRPYAEVAGADSRVVPAAGTSPAAPVAAASVPAIVPTTAPPSIVTAPAQAPAAAPAATGTGTLDGVAFAWPASGTVVQNFNETSSKGLSLGGKAGDVVRSAADGRVIFSGAGPRGYGNLIIVKHDNELLSVYAHNRSLSVKEGETVKRGQKIAELGSSGTDTPKLHFEIRQQGKPIDPLAVLPRR